MHQYEMGQALPLGLALTLFGALSAIVLFNTGQTAIDKTKLANTADAAAYSGLIWQARALNFQSYTNRAMVANQVSMAQAVSLRSWLSYSQTTTQNIGAVLGGVPFVNVIANSMARTMNYAEQIISPVTVGLFDVVNLINGILSKAQTAMYLSSFAATPEVIKQVVEANDTRFTTDTAFTVGGVGLNLHSWQQFTEQYLPSDQTAMDERTDVIQRSMDGFSRSRNWDFFSRYLPIFPMVSIRVERRGKTELIKVNALDGAQWEWKAKDSLSLQTKIWRPFLGTKRIEVPIGWGEAYANGVNGGSIEPCSSPDPWAFSFGGCPEWLGNNRYGEHLADAAQIKISSSYAGIRAFRALSTDSRDEVDPRLVLRVEVAMPVEAINSSTRYVSGNRFAASIKSPGALLSSVSLAEVFYQRPDVPLSATVEAANAYNPYWGVRLKHVPDPERLVALSLRTHGPTSLAPGVSADALGLYINSATGAASNVESELVRIDGLLHTTTPDSTEYALLSAQQTELLALQNANIPNNHDDDAADSVAIALGIDTGSKTSELALTSALLGAGNGLQTYINSQVKDQLGELETVVRDELKDALEQAVSKMLAGAVSGALGQNIGNAMTNGAAIQHQLEDLTAEAESQYSQEAEQYIDVIAAADEKRRQWEAEFERIEEHVATIYAQAKEELMAELNAVQTELREEMQELQALYDSAIPDERKREVSNELLAAEQRYAGLVDEYDLMLAQKLVEVVNGATDIIELPLHVALQVVKEDRPTGNSVIDALKVTELGNEE